MIVSRPSAQPPQLEDFGCHAHGFNLPLFARLTTTSQSCVLWPPERYESLTHYGICIVALIHPVELGISTMPILLQIHQTTMKTEWKTLCDFIFKGHTG
ncbi:hypothetical protein CY34DRAFT_665537 [Suillus luteus UH-Slu-Lm8-n1]|uniref:Uncharacterized protein n=1 Tax=Suillus luteus UH-Slu-Lm8-n1 TaxID=930992 RepID=A0A0D0AIG3_9AGAM|nr:hypothetical protein CY34DRAFT_665537 [Suillus luteus UH-Slu-Lm8-n1]